MSVTDLSVGDRVALADHASHGVDEHLPLGDLDPLVQRLDGVVVLDRHHRLRDDRMVLTPPSTTSSVAPVTFTPWASASAAPCMPGNDGSSAGWALTYAAAVALEERRPTSFMKPARTEQVGNGAAQSRPWRGPSLAGVKSLTRFTKVGTPACSARSSPWMPSRSAPTATTAAPYAGSAQASSRAWRLVPLPDTSTTRSRGLGWARPSVRRSRRPRRTASVSSAGTPLPPRHRQPAEQAADAEGRDRLEEHVADQRIDVAHPPPADARHPPTAQTRRSRRRPRCRRRNRAARPRPSGWSGRPLHVGRREHGDQHRHREARRSRQAPGRCRAARRSIGNMGSAPITTTLCEGPGCRCRR